MSRPDNPVPFAEPMARAYAEEGLEGFWRAVLRAQTGGLDEPDPDMLPIVLRVNSRAYVRLGMYEHLLDLIETAVEARTLHFWVTSLLADPALDPIRSEPRYQAIVERIGIR